MRFYNYLFEKIETKEFRKMVDDAMKEIRSDFSKLESANDFSKLIKKKFKPIFEKVVYEIIGDPSADIKISVRQSGKGLSGRTHYNPNINEFELDMFLGKKTLKTALYDSKIRTRALKLIQDIANHEITHLIQWYRSQGKMSKSKPYYSKEYPSGGGTKQMRQVQDYKEHLSFPEEIETYSVESAEDLVQDFKNDLTIDQMIEILKNEKDLSKLAKINDVIGDYWEYFGKKETVQGRKVWRRFVKKLIQHLEEMKEEL